LLRLRPIFDTNRYLDRFFGGFQSVLKILPSITFLSEALLSMQL